MAVCLCNYINHLSKGIKPYLEDIIDNEYVLDIGLGITIFVIVIFLVLMINKGISKAVRYTKGIGSLDTHVWILFWIFKSLSSFLPVCIFCWNPYCL